MLLNTGRPLWGVLACGLPRAGYFAPVKTPRPILNDLYENFATVVKAPGVAQHARTGYF